MLRVQLVGATLMQRAGRSSRFSKLVRLTVPDRRGGEIPSDGRACGNKPTKPSRRDAGDTNRSLQGWGWNQRQAAGFAVEAAEFDFVEQQRRSDYRAGDAAVG